MIIMELAGTAQKRTLLKASGPDRILEPTLVHGERGSRQVPYSYTTRERDIIVFETGPAKNMRAASGVRHYGWDGDWGSPRRQLRIHQG